MTLSLTELDMQVPETWKISCGGEIVARDVNRQQSYSVNVAIFSPYATVDIVY